MIEHAVVIAGGGPTGLMLAGELAIGGIDVAIVERRTSQDFVGSRARGIHSRTIEVLDQRGIAERFLSQGKTYPVVHFADAILDLSDLPSRHNYVLGLAQIEIERILAGWVEELGVPIYRGCEVLRFSQDDTGVEIAVSNGESLRAQYLVGCDGGRSQVRKTARIDFPGWDATTSWLITEAKVTQEPEWGIHDDAHGFYAASKSENGGVGFVIAEQRLGPASDPTLQDVGAALIAACRTDFGVHDPVWISRFTDMARQAAAYRDRRVLLAGDAAHIHSPVGGQGLDTGVQDAVNLGWKLAQVVKQISPDSLLDTYHAERHPVGARVIRTNMAQGALRNRADERINALRDTVSELLEMAEPRRRFAARMSGLDIRYDFGQGHPLLGRRMPDLDIATADGPRRVFSLLHSALPVLLNFEGRGRSNVAQWGNRIQLVDAACAGQWELPDVGVVSAPSAVLIRPDGHVAWAGDGTPLGLTDALARWFGQGGVA